MKPLSALWTCLIYRGKISFLLLLTATIWGIFSYQTMPRESSPEVEVPVGIVTTVWPGASAVDTERLITEKIEQKIHTLDQVKQYTSISQTGLSIIQVEFEAGSNLSENIQKLREAVNRAEKDLPQTIADDPFIEEANVNNLPLLSLNLSGDFSVSELKSIAKTFQKNLETIPGVREVVISGIPEEGIHVYLDTFKLQKLSLNTEDVARAIRSAHQDIPLGSVFLQGERLDVRVKGEGKLVQDFLDIPLGERNGKTILLQEVADIRREFEVPNVEPFFSTGGPLYPSVTINLIKAKAKTNIAKVVKEAFSRIEALKNLKSIPSNLQVVTTFNSAEDIEKDLKNLLNNGIQTIVLVTIALFLSVGWREGLLALISIPISLFISMGILRGLGETFNFLSLFSLILAIGLLVDNSIIVVEGISENIFYKKLKPIEAAVRSIQVFRWPIISGTFTTLFAFLPMMFLISGVSGQFVRIIPLTVMVILAASLLVALFLVPVLGVWLFTIFPPKRSEGEEVAWLKAFQDWYGPKMLNLLSSRKKVYTTLGITFGTFVFSVLLVVWGFVPIEIFPGSDENFFSARIELPPGTDLSKTKEEFSKFGAILKEIFKTKEGEISDFKNVIITFGQRSSFDPSVIRGAGGGPSSEIIGITFNLQDRSLRKETTLHLTEKVEKILKPYFPSPIKVSVNQIEGGPPSGQYPIEIEVTTTDFSRGEFLSKSLKEELSKLKLSSGATLKNITDDRGDLIPQITFKADREKMERLGITLGSITQSLQASGEGAKVLSLVEGDEEIDFELRLHREGDPKQWGPLKTIENLKSLPLKTLKGDSVPFGEIMSFEIQAERSVLRHKNGRRTIKVGADIEGKGTASQFLPGMQKSIKNLTLQSGEEISIGGDNEEGNRLIREMGLSMILAVFLIALVLLLQFDSYSEMFTVVIAIPLSLTAVFLGYWIFQTPISFPTMIGIVSLAGIVVNDDIVLIEQIKNHHEGNFIEAMVKGAQSRMRPILLTSITNIIGMLPLAFSDPIWQGLGLAIVYGMTLSTVLTLLLNPCVLFALKDLENWIHNKIKKWIPSLA